MPQKPLIGLAISRFIYVNSGDNQPRRMRNCATQNCCGFGSENRSMRIGYVRNILAEIRTDPAINYRGR
jgi:hypothetical protein